jgi:hypothetical protein
MVALPVASLILGGIGTAVSALGAYNSAKSQAQQAQYQSEVSANNAKIAGYNASLESQKGAADVARQGALNRARLGAEAAQEGALGTDVNSGSNVDTRVSERGTALTDVATLSHNSQLAAYGYQNQSMAFTSQAGAESTAAENANASALPAAGGSLIEGASSLVNKWTTFQNSGAIGGGGGGSGSNTAATGAMGGGDAL